MENKRVLLASRPDGWVREDNFRIESVPVPRPRDGEVLVKNAFLSLDPYMRGRMNEGKSYAARQEIGEVMIGGTVGEVIESNNPKFAVGDKVLGMLGWQQYGLSDGKGLGKVDAERVPMSAYLGVLGMPGVTAWVGLLDICQPKAGETVLVSAASGAVGGVVGQIAKLRGCRAVGIAGGRQKCDYVVNELGFDACVDYKAGKLNDDLKAAAPKGVDCYFENVGGEILDAALRRMNPFSRIAVCGLISQYNATEPYGVKTFQSILTNRIKVQGFIVSDRMELWARALPELIGWVASGRIKYRE
ncbi:MAG TPA: NADP-dependent oxidoreductase, partial [Burkholderiales bacterium]